MAALSTPLGPGRRGAAGSSASHALCFSSSSDDEFELFLAKMKTPKSVSKKEDSSLKDFIDDSMDDFFLDFKKSTKKKGK